MKIKLTNSEKAIHACEICSRPADFLAIMKIAGNKFLCYRCVERNQI